MTTTEPIISTFAALGLPLSLVEALESAGISTPFPIQALTIPDGLAGRDVCGKAKTGSGKTLAFGLPLLTRVEHAAPKRPRGLVLVPTRELALQVADVLEPLGRAVDRRVIAVYGGAKMDRQIAELRAGVDIVIATPGRLIDLVDRAAVSLSDVEVLVLDEADRMVDMGFLPQVEWLLRHITSEHQTLLFSATLDGAIDHLVRSELRDPVRHEVVSGTITVEEMTHRFLLVHEMDKVRVLAAIARHHLRTLAFVRSKRGADQLANALKKEGIAAAAIHGDLHQRDRERALTEFSKGRLAVLVATDVAARGLDIDDIDIVVHYDPPQDPKDYLHRSGRTARAGDSGIVVTLVLWNEELEVRRLQRRLALGVPIVQMFSNDPRLGDLTGWEPQAEEAVGAR
ncbi:MAG TPA: DEAD/DEAH box helicase [Acidimicrobiales bacterium]|nr:DEAD/DEAH box helicase [Acidimicrobiales bacterium]